MIQENEDFKILTDYILSIEFMQRFDFIDFIDFDSIEDWAIQLINLGFENEALYTLATFYKPINPDEILPYLKRTFLELDLKEKEGDEAEACYARYHLAKVAKGENVKKNLYYAIPFYAGHGRKAHPEVELNFGVLSEIWLDMKYDPDYWYRGVNISNIEQKVIEKAKWWLKNNPIS